MTGADAGGAPGSHSHPDGQHAFRHTPNAERYLLEADSLRRRQLRAALLHGTARTWRDRRRTWPAALGGAAVSAVIVAAIAVYGAFEQQKRINEQQERQRNTPVPVATARPSPSPTRSVRPSTSRSPRPARTVSRSPSASRSR